MPPSHADETGDRAPAPTRAHLDRQGRVVIPAAVRHALGIRPDDPLVMTVEERGRLVVETRDAYIARLQRDFGPHVASVDELITARRVDAERELLTDPQPEAVRAPAKAPAKR